MLDLNNPLTRQNVLRERLDVGAPLVAASIAAELGVSIDTVRRDLIALERQGLVRRVRGGAVPTTAPMPPYIARAEEPDPILGALAERAVQLVPEDGTVFFDAGTTMNAIAARIPQSFRGLIVTAAPSVALAALNAGARVHLVGGALCPEGAMSTGGQAEAAVTAIAADLCMLGACGLWPDFGLSAEDAGEAGVKRAMARAATQIVVVTSATKLDRLGRHRVLSLNEIDALVTDASDHATNPFAEAGMEVFHV
ncbi:DeoR/GlpR family DNA-binding transcription regulator [Ruegeria sp. HKCCD8929]|uniref:DeoR/GlpR family DNA-binding transcription regulator n=1 Tax=Ruegeria sp. HKCCD8929 TaxID=2683006 RepID=UPI00148810F0|nr:DeoR/GlpR family DNA-binding transcription regulator [Ruegeria sp. HKCCD8929]